MSNKDNLVIIGAGLAGPLMATYLSNLGYNVDIYERRPDMRYIDQSAGKSINLALSKRGIRALRDIGLYEKIKSKLIPMKGRMIHNIDGSTQLQKYGQKTNEVIYSISRAFLNISLMEYCENNGNVRIHCEHELEYIDMNEQKLIFTNHKSVKFNRVLGSDGSSSIIRQTIDKLCSINFQKKPLLHGYKELSIPSTNNGDFKLDPNALHIWPRGKFMLIALPNMDGSFTSTLFLPMDGKISFSSIKTKKQILDFFQENFPDALDLFTDIIETYQNNPIGTLSTVYCDKWHYKDKLLIFGDAAHAIVPFFGQGMNASFQDCTVINSLINKFNGDWDKIFPEFSTIHIANGHAIANMALENYIEMRDLVNNPDYKTKRNLELQLENKFRNRFIPRYSMVSFHTIPYAEVYERGLIQNTLMNNYISGTITKDMLHEKILDQLDPIS